MKSVVLLSGGVDSTVCVAWELLLDHEVSCLTVDYGQLHIREVQAARLVAELYGLSHCVVKVDPVLFGGSAITGGGDVPEGHAEAPDATYVPARNTMLVALAAAYAESIGAGIVVLGANADDQAGYPDCRWDFIQAYRNVLSLGTVNKVWLSAPLLKLSKREVVVLGQRLDAPLGLTWSCYRGGEQPCGMCGACTSLGVTV